MKTYIKSPLGILTALGLAAICSTARADIVGGTYTLGTSPPTQWDQLGGLSPFFTTVTNSNPTQDVGWSAQSANLNNSSRIVPGAKYAVLAQTMWLPAGNYQLTGFSMILNGVSSPVANPVSVHLFDITRTMFSGDGSSITNGGGLEYNIGGDLFGKGNGLVITNAAALPAGSNQCLFALSNGSLGNDANIVVGGGHVYSLEFWLPTSSLYEASWWRCGATDTTMGGLLGEGMMGGGEWTNRITIASAGNGGNPRFYFAALYGNPTGSALTVSTNAPPGMTNYFIDTFPSATYSGGGISSVYTNWFGTAVANPSGIGWTASDAYGLFGNSGSMQVSANFDSSNLANDQFAIINGAGFSPALKGTKFLRFEADVKFDSGSATTVNANSLTSYGHLQFGTTTNTGQDYFGSTEIPQGDNTWNHLVMAFDPVNGDTNFASIPDLLIHIDGNWYTANPINGSSTLHVDNLKFTGPLSSVAPPPTMEALTAAKPGLRIWTPDGGRENFGTVYSNFDWTVSSPSYAFTFTNFPNTNYNFFQFRMFFVPLASLRTDYGGNWWQNAFFDNDTTNLAGIMIHPTGTNYACDFLYKINQAPAFPTNVLMEFLTPQAVGTWTLSFSSATAATLTAPNGSSTNFNLTFSTAPFVDCSVVFSAVANNSATYFQAADLASANLTTGAGVATENFSTSSSYDPGLWIPSGANTNSIWMTGPYPKWWVTWSQPDTGWYLVESTNLANGNSWINPTNFPAGYPLPQRLLTTERAALLSTNHIPTGTVNNLFLGLRLTPQ